MIRRLDHEEERKLLSTRRIARLGCVINGEPYVVPVNYIFDGEYAYVHSLPGRKITALRAHPRACLQVDLIEDTCHWQSVLAFGDFEEIHDPTERAYYLGKLLARYPLLTPVESAMAEDAEPPSIILFRIRIDKICGISES